MAAILALMIILVLAPVAHAAASEHPGCDRQMISQVDGVQVWTSGDAIGFTTSKLAVDADGAPASYRVDGKGLSFTCDGVAALIDGERVTTKNPNWQQLC